jgi:hypothetical protein
MQEEGEVKMVTIKSINEPQDQEHTSEVKCFSAYKISNPGFDSLIYSGKPEKVNRKRKYYYKHTISSCSETSGSNDSQKTFDSFAPYQNKTDPNGNGVVINFYLPKDALTEIILMDENRTEVLFLLNKELKAGQYSFNTGISNIELEHFHYFYKLNADGYSEVREMKHC